MTLRRILAVMAGLAFGVISSELSFGRLRPESGAPSVLYSIEVRNQAGDLLASPMVVGEEGRPVHLHATYVGERSELNMSLDLDPQPDGEGAVCLGYKLSIEDGFPHAGRVGLPYGEMRSVRLIGGGESLRLSLVVARAHTKEFEQILHRRRRPAA